MDGGIETTIKMSPIFGKGVDADNKETGPQDHTNFLAVFKLSTDNLSEQHGIVEQTFEWFKGQKQNPSDSIPNVELVNTGISFELQPALVIEFSTQEDLDAFVQAFEDNQFLCSITRSKLCFDEGLVIIENQTIEGYHESANKKEAEAKALFAPILRA